MGLLTSDDLDLIGCTAGDQPLEVATDLVDAVDHGLVADQADTGYALILAAEITERTGDLRDAHVLAERAVEAYRACDDPDGYPRAFRAGLLLRLGRVDEAMAELTALRPLLSEDPHTASYLSEALVDGGHTQLAERWLTEALDEALQWLNQLDSEQGQPVYEQAMAVALALAMERHEVRRLLNLPHDDHDDLADVLTDVVRQVLGDDEDEDYEGTALLFWPRPEFDRLLLRWPVLAEDYGHSWDEHRTLVQRTLVQLSESGQPRLALLAGAADELAAYAVRHGGDPIDPQIRAGYAEHLEVHPQRTAWPPTRNQVCWCGSALKYKKCCFPRVRT